MHNQNRFTTCVGNDCVVIALRQRGTVTKTLMQTPPQRSADLGLWVLEQIFANAQKCEFSFSVWTGAGMRDGWRERKNWHLHNLTNILLFYANMVYWVPAPLCQNFVFLTLTWMWYNIYIVCSRNCYESTYDKFDSKNVGVHSWEEKENFFVQCL